jgi:hypothetical protein
MGETNVNSRFSPAMTLLFTVFVTAEDQRISCLTVKSRSGA